MKVSRSPTARVSAQPVDASLLRRLEFVGGGSSKFWEASTTGSSMTVRWGKIGTAGQSQQKEFQTAAQANAELQKLMTEKMNKGYLDAGAPPALDDVAADAAANAALAHVGGVAITPPAPGGVSAVALRAGGVPAWRKLNDDKKVEALEGDRAVAGTTLMEDVSALTPAQRAVVDKIVAQASGQLPDNEEGGDNVCQIGSPQAHVGVLVDSSGDVLGVAVHFTQSGGALPDDGGDDLSSHYSTKAEALAAGVDVEADVSWSLSEKMMFDGAGKELRDAASAYWDWSGW